MRSAAYETILQKNRTKLTLKVFSLFLAIICVAASLHAQSFRYMRSIGEFDKAAGFSINDPGFIYVIDSITEELMRYDTLGVELESTGGYGWENDSFDEPNDVFSTPLNVFVCDFNNHAVKQYDRDLNFIFTLFTRDEGGDAAFGYPISCATSNLGDLYVLDSETPAVLKFDFFGTYDLSFGTYDYGEYALDDPTEIAVTSGNRIIVLDTDRLLFFDSFGTGLFIQPLPQVMEDVSVVDDYITVTSTESIFFSRYTGTTMQYSKIVLEDFEISDPLVSSAIYRGKLYVLTEKEIHIFALNQ